MDESGTVQDVRALHAAHAGYLHAFALRATGDPGVADEIVQDTLVRAWRAADRYDPERGDVRTWLFAIARNLVVDHHRRRAARPVAPVDGDRLDGPGDDGIDIDRTVERWQVAEALARLSPAHREAIVEIHLRGSSVAEAADRLGAPAGTVKSRVYYGLRALRLELEEMGVVR
ncbi:MAG: sigma-70 family RNA polymerase sigma factor [Actinobacteria bacterium]|nr:sigma-70 family RNA polymerase sigma factor [Actinomycetota bacterium]